MTPHIPKKTALRVLIPGLSMLLLVGFAACDKSTNPPGDPCKDNAALCTPRATLIDSGAVFFQSQNCAGCHGESGEGGRCPPVANSDFLMNNRVRSIAVILRGNNEPLYVHGSCYSGGMPAWGAGFNGGTEGLSDFQIASILTYLRASLNDSTVTDCNTEGKCTVTARSADEIAKDSIAVWEVKAVRDTLHAYPDGYFVDCPATP